MGLQRPVWTVCFGLIWVVILVALIVLHYATSSLVPALQAFPANLLEGFDIVFGFDKLGEEAENMKESADRAIARCNVADAAAYCQLHESGNICNKPGADTTSKDASAEKQEILDAFDRGLAKIRKVGNDKYLGMEAFQEAAASLDQVAAELEKIQANGPCCATTELFCGIRKQSEELTTMGDSVSEQIAGVKDSMEALESQGSRLVGLHAMPYLLVISEIFFAILWWKNGACCCCSNGTCFQTLFLIVPQVLLWLVAYVIMMAFTAVGWFFSIFVMPMKLSDMPNEPTVEDLINHVYTEFPDFWNLVLAPLASSGSTFVTGSTIFTIACVYAILYSCCFCCCRPYGTGMCEHGVPDNVYCKECEEPGAN